MQKFNRSRKYEVQTTNHFKLSAHSPFMIPWIEKYSPKSVGDIPQRNVFIVENFLKNFSRGQSLIISGPTGSGKTALVHALAQQYNLELVEINASDSRNASAIDEIVGGALMQGSIFGSKKIIFVDEIDGVSGTKDRGGVQALAKLLGNNAHPVILSANDCTDSKFSPLRKVCKIVEFFEISPDDGSRILGNICSVENLSFDEPALRHLVRRNAGDLRASITDLQLLSVGCSSVTVDNVNILGYRAKEESIQQALTKIFKSRSFNNVVDAFDNVPEDVDGIIPWLEENVFREYENFDLLRAMNFLSLADIFRSRIQRRQHWRFLAVVFPLITAGISLSKDFPKRSPPVYKEPTLIFSYWRAKNERAKSFDFSSKMSLHCSARKFSLETLPFLKFWVGSDSSWKNFLDSEEVDWLKKKL